MTSAIVLDHVSKRFKVPTEHALTLQQRFIHPISTSRYRTLAALDDVSFAVPAGQFLGITGPNGCGKSTLLKILARIYAPDEGSITVRGRLSPFLELGVGFKNELTARDNVFLGGAVLGLTRAQLEACLPAVLEFAELTEFEDQKIKNFSSGMVLRLAFAVAMLANADVLLMDEVLAVGDAHFQEKCFDVFASYKRQGRTVVLVSHDLNALETHCDRVILLNGGRVAADGSPRDVTSEYRRLVAGIATDQAQIPKTPMVASKRWGTGEVQVAGVELYGDDGPQQTFFTGARLAVRVEYTVARAVGDFACAVGFNRLDGLGIAGPNSLQDGTRLRATADGQSGVITYSIPVLALLAGRYSIAVGLYDHTLTHAFDHLDEVVTFQVSDERGRAGIVSLDGRWSVEEAVEAPQGGHGAVVRA